MWNNIQSLHITETSIILVSVGRRSKIRRRRRSVRDTVFGTHEVKPFDENISNELVGFIGGMILVPKHILASVFTQCRRWNTRQRRPDSVERATRWIRVIKSCIAYIQTYTKKVNQIIRDKILNSINENSFSQLVLLLLLIKLSNFVF